MARLVILDRDGTINVERHYLTDPGQVELLERAAAGLRVLRRMGLKLVVVSNQSAVGRGYTDEETLARIHDRLLELLQAEGAELDAIYVCPHTPSESCRCRKPGLALLERAAQDFGADLREAFLIGDQASDIEAGRRANATTLLVTTGYGGQSLGGGNPRPDYVVPSLLDAAHLVSVILGRQRLATVGTGFPGPLTAVWERWSSLIQAQLLEAAEVKRLMSQSCTDAILAAAQVIVRALRSGGKVMLCGNGGSAADAQHIAAELVGRLRRRSERPALAALALTTDTSCLTALANDFGFEQVFERQVQALGRPEDVLVGISTSGDSQNVVRAVNAARAVGMGTVALLGQGGRSLEGLVDVAIAVPSSNTPRTQEGHIAAGHILCELVEQMLFAG